MNAILVFTALGIWILFIVIKEFAFDRKPRKQLYKEIFRKLDNVEKSRKGRNSAESKETQS